MTIRILLTLCAVTLAGCRSNAPVGQSAEVKIDVPVAASTDNRVAKLHVRGMSCPLCANSIDKQLLKVPGVERVSVNLGNGEVLVRLAAGAQPTSQQLSDAIERSGFTLAGIEMPSASSTEN